MAASSAQIAAEERPVRAAGPSLRNRRVGRQQSGAERGRLNLSWLLHLHWWAILGQGVVIVVAESWSGIGLPVRALAALLGVEVIGNLALGVWARRVRVTDASIAGVMLLATAILTVLLDLTGGASNPFSTLYLVEVALAAVLLPPRWSWALMAASLSAFALLFLHEAISGQGHHIRSQMDPQRLMDAHLRGMWIAFALAAIFVVFFVQRVGRALADRERELQRAHEQGERREKLASLATLAAGAAHELSTPLSTIAVVAKELQRSLAPTVPAEVQADLQLVRDQVGRCREILDRMAANAGENAGEPIASLPVRAWVEASLEGLAGRERVTVDLRNAADAVLVGPPRALAAALRGLLKNALQASPADATVALRIGVGGGRVRASVVDRGRGMAPEVLARVGEPFFTTKGPGEGMGLGLFLTRALAEQIGGDFQIVSYPGAGTEAWIDLPAADAGGRSTQ